MTDTGTWRLLPAAIPGIPELDADQSARLTKLMYTGIPKKVISPLDRQGHQGENSEESGQSEE